MSATEQGLGPKRFVKPRKHPKAPWVSAFPDQRNALHPERGQSGGIRGRSGAQEVRIAVYRAIADLFKKRYPWCEICIAKGNRPNPTCDVHHKRGRNGLLLFDVRYFVSACRTCHNWAGDNPKDAADLGVTDLQRWRRIE